MQRSRRSPAANAALALAGAALLMCAQASRGQAGTLSISAVVLSKSNCKFSTNTGMTLNFGTIDPSAAGPAVATAAQVFTCGGSATTASFSFTASNGAFYSSTSGTRQMRHATLTNEFLPYSLSLSPASGTMPKGGTQTLTVTGTITKSQYQNANVGTFGDSVTITLVP